MAPETFDGIGMALVISAIIIFVAGFIAGALLV